MRQNVLNRLWTSIGTKIVLPYVLLTIIVAGVGAFIIVRFVTGSLQERFVNQLLDAGRITSESMVDYEAERLQILRTVIGTEGVDESLAADNRDALAARVPQIIANSNVDAVELINQQGQAVYGWQRPPRQTGNSGEERSGADFSQLPEIRRVLDGFVDVFGEKRVMLSQTPYGPMLFTLGPVYFEDRVIGVALVGTYITEMVDGLANTSAASVTLYDQQGNTIETTLGRGQQTVTEILQEPTDQYETVLSLLAESPAQYPVIVTNAETEVPLRQVKILGQDYTLAYGDWRVRGQSIGFFSVALPNNFIVTTASTSRTLLSTIFFLVTLGVLVIGFVLAQWIITPLRRLVQSSTLIAQGDLSQRTGIRRNDEIGNLASSFDIMTDHLEERTHQLIEQASKLEAILNSTLDGMIVLDPQNVVITANPVARQILAEISDDFLLNILRDRSPSPIFHRNMSDDHPPNQIQQSHRYQVGDRVFSALVAPVVTPEDQELGTVIALRDVTREAEAEQLKDGFITSISHDLRTPLTSLKGYSEILLYMANDNLNDKQQQFMQIINDNANQLIEHVNEIIDISELQAGTLRLEKGEVALEMVVEQVVNQWCAAMEEKGLSLKVTLPPESLLVVGDASRLQWAINNLVKNAHDYTLSGGHVEIDLFRTGDMARLDVRDTGIGIHSTDHPYLFTRFFRANNDLMYNVAGVGLGLFITRSLIELHEGKVWAESKLNEGSLFSLSLPILEKQTPVA